MKAIRLADRGSAVEDIQRRLRLLGYSLGTTGVDGVFLEATAQAVSAFQQENELPITGYVGADTWSALVDATFSFGDRMLYLRQPHFHGADVAQLQRALSSLGFPTGGVDGIFGVFTERALTEFQYNSALIADGVAGQDTFRHLDSLRHMWADKSGLSHSAATAILPARLEVLAHVKFSFQTTCEDTIRIARRANNLVAASAEANQPSTTIDVILTKRLESEQPPTLLYSADMAGLAHDICQNYTNSTAPIYIGIPDDMLATGALPGPQHIASSLVDALCMAYSQLFCYTR